jgi:hypothetical protein
MKNLTHLVRVQKTNWINPAHIVRIKMADKNKLELCIHLTGGAVITLGDDDAKKVLATLQAAD